MNELKSLLEQRDEAVIAMKELVAQSETERRALTDDESNKFDELEATVNNLNKTIEAQERARALEITKEVPMTTVSNEEMEVRAFAQYIREARDDGSNLTFNDNGAVIPTTIANKIITKVHEISPIFNLATVYNVKGALTIPYYPADDNVDMAMGYADEFTELASSAGTFGSVTLNGYLAGVLTLISKSLVNNSDFDLVNFVVNYMAEKIAAFLEKEILNGTENKATGALSGITRTVENGAIDADSLISLQELIPDVYQGSACWIMSRADRTAIRQLKDGEDRYLLNPDYTAQWGYTLLGKPVYVSENLAEGTIIYGDMSGIAVKLTEAFAIQVLLEHYAPQHAIGVLAWTEFDAAVENAQKLAKLVVGGD